MLSNFQTVLCLPIHYFLIIYIKKKKKYNEINVREKSRISSLRYILFFPYKIKNKSLNKIPLDKEINNGKIMIFFIEKFGCTLHNF